MDAEVEFNNACYNATLDYARWERIKNKEPEDILSLLLSALQVIDAAETLLEKYSELAKQKDLPNGMAT